MKDRSWPAIGLSAALPTPTALTCNANAATDADERTRQLERQVEALTKPVTDMPLSQLQIQTVVLEHNGATTRLARPLNTSDPSGPDLLAELLYGQGLELLCSRNGLG